MSSYLTKHAGPHHQPQSMKADERQEPNSAGGFSFTVTPLDKLRRFLILGTEGGSYYASEKNLTFSNVANLDACVKADGVGTVAEIVAVSEGGRAPKNDPALFALAYAHAHGDLATKHAVREALPRVARTGTHLFQFVEFSTGMRRWGRGLRNTVRDWYLKDNDALALQVVKYRQRGRWTHRDVLRTAHAAVGVDSPLRDNVVLDWLAHGKQEGWEPKAELPKVIEGFLLAQESPSSARTAELVRKYRLPREALLTEHLNDPVVWEAMLDAKMPMTALMRNLATMTRLGLLTNTSAWTKTVVERMIDAEGVLKSRVHPFNVLVAMKTYESGRGFRGSNTWDPARKVVDALNDMFYLAYGNVTPTGKRTMLALDVSGSMGSSPVMGGVMSARDATAAMALVTANVEEDYEIVGFTAGGGSDSWKSPNKERRGWGSGDGITPLAISPRQRLTDAVNTISGLNFGSTDCSLPMLYAAEKGIDIDTFVIYTDNETWSGSIHPHEALERYRQKRSIDAKMVVVGMTATDFTIANPTDPGMLDVVGLDTATPELISGFARGDF